MFISLCSVTFKNFCGFGETYLQAEGLKFKL